MTGVKGKPTNRIREVAKEKGWQMFELAEKMGMTRQNLSRLLIAPSYPSLLRFAEVLEVPVWQLFASPEEAYKQSAHGVTLDLGVCPHCGKPVKLCLNLEKA